MIRLPRPTFLASAALLFAGTGVRPLLAAGPTALGPIGVVAPALAGPAAPALQRPSGGARPSSGGSSRPSVRPSGGGFIGGSRPSASPSRPSIAPSRPSIAPSRPSITPSRPSYTPPSRPTIPSSSSSRPIVVNPPAPRPTAFDRPASGVVTGSSGGYRPPAAPLEPAPGASRTGLVPSTDGARPLDLPPNVIEARPAAGTVRVPVPRFYQPGTGSNGGASIASDGRRVGSSADQYRAGVVAPELSSVAARRSLSTLVERYGRSGSASPLTSVDETRANLERIAARRSTMSPRDATRLDYARGPLDRLANPDRRPSVAPERVAAAPAPLVPSERTAAPIATRSSRLANLRVTDPDRAQRLADSGRALARVQDELITRGLATVGGRPLAQRMRNQLNGAGSGDGYPIRDGSGGAPQTSDSYFWGPGYGFNNCYQPYWTACYPGWYWGGNYGGLWNPYCWGWYGLSNAWYWGWSACYPSYYGTYFGNYHGFYGGFGFGGGLGFGGGFGGGFGFGYPVYYSTALYAAQEQQPVQVIVYNDSPAQQAVAYADPLAAAPEPGFDPTAAGFSDSEFGDGLDLGADRYLTLGDRAFRDGDWTQAASYYTKATEVEPEVGVLYLVLSDALFAAGDYGHAAVAIRRALTLEPELARSTVDKTEFYADPADFERHLETARGFVAENPGNGDARLALAVNELFSARLEDAAATMAADAGALATDPAAALVRGAISSRR